jgi:heat shock protein HtpX
MTIYTHIGKNIWKTWFLMVGFLIFIILLGWLFSRVLESPVILWIAVIFAILMNVFSYWYSDKIVLKMTGAKPIEKKDNPELYRIVENLSISAGLPLPKICIVNDPQPNAFATGRDPKHAVVAFTTGILERLNRSELEGVAAHELSHIGNRDMLVSTIAVVLAGLVILLSDFFLRIGLRGGGRRGGHPIILIIALAAAILAPLVAQIIHFAISRRREYLADASGALLTRYPEGLANALKKISAYPASLARANHATAHLYIANPFRGKEAVSFLTRLFMTHPPIEKRIQTLEQMNK